MKKLAWTPMSRNETLSGDGFYVSYNPQTRTGHLAGLLTDLANALGCDVKDGEETALCVKGGERTIFYILEGDFREEYEQAFPQGLDACMQVYEKNKEAHNSNWSTRV